MRQRLVTEHFSKSCECCWIVIYLKGHGYLLFDGVVRFLNTHILLGELTLYSSFRQELARRLINEIQVNSNTGHVRGKKTTQKIYYYSDLNQLTTTLTYSKFNIFL